MIPSYPVGDSVSHAVSLGKETAAGQLGLIGEAGLADLTDAGQVRASERAHQHLAHRYAHTSEAC